MSVKLLTEHDLEFLSLKGNCTGSSEFTLVKMMEITCGGSYQNEPHHENVGLRGLQSGRYQTIMFSYS